MRSSSGDLRRRARRSRLAAWTLGVVALAAALTSEVWGDQLLGQSVEVSVPNTATWLATANNVELSFELTRRCVRIRIDTKHDMPWQRAGFRHDPLLEWVREQRAALVQAALTLVQAWVAAGKPKGNARLGAFESWASTMSGILEVAGIGGLLANSADFYERSDTDGEAWRVLGERLGEAFQIADDILDVCAKAETIGKPVGKDETLGRPSAVRQFGLRGAIDHFDELVAEAVASVPACPGAEQLRTQIRAQTKRLLPKEAALHAA